MTGWVPYTYCHAHTFKPSACNVATSVGVNCDQKLVPSELLMNSVPTSAACAWLTIDARLPPSDLFTYQIHIPCPPNAVPATVGGGVGPVGPVTPVGPGGPVGPLGPVTAADSGAGGAGSGFGGCRA